MTFVVIIFMMVIPRTYFTSCFYPHYISQLYHSLTGKFCNIFMIFCLFVLLFYIPVNSCGHGETVSSPNHIFSWASLNKWLTSTSGTYFRLQLLNYFMFNLHEIMGPLCDRNCDPWICSQTCISSQTRYLYTFT